MILVLLGPPGSGKGTLAKLLSSQLNIPHISTGDILREEAKLGTFLGKKVKLFMEKGELVPDQIILEVMKERIRKPNCQKGFLLDGFPRTMPQALGLDDMLKSWTKSIDLVLKFDLSDECVLKRLGGRLICSGCGAFFNLYTKPPQKDLICDLCGSQLHQRPDDAQEVILKRLKVYKAQTIPIEEYYNKQGKLRKAYGELDPDSILKNVLNILQSKNK
ncbi:MAG: adenylate kinase [candidate division Zixibacteria bacterium SM23_73]|nr:MAG: adenylate kinase [candidate division Zixibacteria bacterium SM23_73]